MLWQAFGRWGGLGTEGSTPPGGNDPNYGDTVLLLGMNGSDGATTTSDESPSVHGSASFFGGAALDTAQAKFGASSLLLDGNGDYINFAGHDDWSFGLGEFTVEAWIRFAAQSDIHTIVSHWNNTGTSEWMLNYAHGGPQLEFLYNTAAASGTATDITTASWAPSLNTWHHVAVDRDAGGTLRLYANGSMIGSEAANETFASGTGSLDIGRLNDHSSPNYFNGWIDEVRITKGVARYASDSGYSVPTSAFPRS